VRNPLIITDVRLNIAPREHVRKGLLGWIACTINDTLRLDGLSLRKTLRGRLTLSFPAKPGLTGAQFFYTRPLDDRTRREIEAQVFAQLGLTESVPR